MKALRLLVPCFALFFFIVIASGVFAAESRATKATISDMVMTLTLKKHHLASDVAVLGKTLKVLVTFQHNRSVDVIHDPEIIAFAKQAGLKRVEFHDWSGFSKEYISSDIK